MQFHLLRSIILLFLLSMLSAIFSKERYVSLNRGTGDGVVIKILEQDASHTRLAITVSGYYEKTVSYEGKQGKVLSTPDMFSLPSGGVPDIPLLNRIIQVPDQAVVDYKILKKTQKVIRDIQIAPTRRPMFIGDNPDTIPRKTGQIYGINKKFPEELFGIASVGIMRDVRTLKYFFSAYQYNPVQSELTITSKIVVDFIYDYEAAKLVKAESAGIGAKNLITSKKKHPSKTFNRIYQQILPNYAPAKLNTTVQRNAVESASAARDVVLFIVGAALDGQAVSDFFVYKDLLVDQNGDEKFNVYLHTFPTFGTAEDVKAIIQNYYTYYNLTYVILIGDVEHIPTYQIPLEILGDKGSPPWPFNNGYCWTDQDYALLDGDDLGYEVLVSRFSAKNETELARQFTKVIAYEGAASTESWVKRGFVACNHELPPRIIFGKAVANAMRYHPQFDLDGIIFHEGSQGTADFYSKVLQAFNDGTPNTAVNMFTYLGHGNPYGLGLGFSVPDIPALNNTSVFPLMYIIACDIGDFNGWQINHDDCFSEAMMKAGSGSTPHGPASIFSAAYVCPYEAEPAMQSAFTDKFYNEEFGSFGEFCMVTKQVAVNWVATTDPLDLDVMANYLHPDYIIHYVLNILGDCTLEMKVGSPVQQDYTLYAPGGIETNPVNGPIVFTASDAVETEVVTVNPTGIASYNRIRHDFEALARREVRLTDGFRVNLGAKAHIAIDPDLINIAPFNQ